MLTDVLSSRRRRSNQGVLSRAISQFNAQLYREIAQLSGGQTIEVSKLDLPRATAVIEDSLATAVVRHKGTKWRTSFHIDSFS